MSKATILLIFLMSNKMNLICSALFVTSIVYITTKVVIYRFDDILI